MRTRSEAARERQQQTETVEEKTADKSPNTVEQDAQRMALALRSVQAEEGESVELTVGPEVYSPVKYNTFTIGPFSTRVFVRPGEDRNDAILRGYRLLLELNEAEFNLAWERHRKRLKLMPRQE